VTVVKAKLVAWFVLLGMFATAGSAANSGRGTWNVREFWRVPATHPAPAELGQEGMEALFFDGPEHEGKPTRVFAYLGLPAAIAPGTTVPGIVLVHGGGGTAFPEWVKLWTARGYAAVALDTGGNVPAKNKAGRERHAWAGPVDGGASIALGDKPPRDQWMYHAVADIMLAHSLLAAQPGVDGKRIGLTGISWGGVLTAEVAGVDSRFAACVPVYGCGFLEDSEAFRPSMGKPGGARWWELWDPSHFLPDARAPILWVNGTNDRFFQPDIWQRSALLAGGQCTLLMIPRMGHGHGDGRKPTEIGVFLDAVLKHGTPLAVCGEPQPGSAGVTVAVSSEVAITGAKLHFTRDAGVASKRLWEEVPARWEPTLGRVTAALPAGSRHYFLSVTDGRGCTVTTQVCDAAP
jgi:dienelactone hydrolase